MPTRSPIAAYEEPDGRWPITLYFREAPDEAAVRALVALASTPALADALTFDTLAPTDWVRKSLEGLKPVEAGRFVVHGAHDRARIAANRIGIEIEAGLAFGTGHHGTTRGCLLALDRLVKERLPAGGVLDVGTGTGVLAIAAAKSLHRPVLASDIDRRAVHTARENVRINRAGIAYRGHAGRRACRPAVPRSARRSRSCSPTSCWHRSSNWHGRWRA